MSEANRVSVKIIPEATYGTTPSNGTWQALRYTSTSLAAAPQTVVSNEIRSDRQVSDLILVGNQVTGDLAFELSDGTYDDLLEAVMMNAWATDVLTVGTDDSENQFSIEVGMEDWTAAHYLQYKGMRVGGMSMNFAYGAVVTGSFNFMGKEATESATSLVGTGSTTAATTSDVMNGSGDVTSITLDGGAITGTKVRSISLNVNNNLRPVEAIGTVGPSDQNAGRATITGTMEIYFDAIDLYQELLANTAIAVQWTVSDGTNSYTFLMNNVKFNSGVPAVQGVDTDVMLPLEFTALYDATHSALKITRA